MKKVLLSFLLLLTATAVSARTIVKGDMNGENEITIADVTIAVDVVQDRSLKQTTYVDLGLPSKTLWASCNIGAKTPEDYGDYFAWGETAGYNDGKTDFNWSTYKWCEGSKYTMSKYCSNSSYGNNGFTDDKTELDLEDDAAYVNWGPAWRMPSLEQFEELINSQYTTTTWTTQNGVNGYRITSKSNDNSIFLPAAGSRNNSSLNYAGSYGRYWSRALYESYPRYARYLQFKSGGIYTDDDSRFYGFSVRPVRLSE